MFYINTHCLFYTALSAFAITNVIASIDSEAYVGAHNAKRKLHERTPPLQYDALLESSAKAHADQCLFRLLEQDDDIGSNLARGFSTWSSAVDAWYAGIQYYNPLHPMDNATKTDRFTQVVWKATKKIGCSKNTACVNGTLIVCYYSPSGNWVGEYSANVMPLIARKPELPQHTAVIL
ncbi:CAP domain-containing protein [Umbelopsis sp. AD052]|nr:CAP domain-containing protein [Umbelopsis sp. AD052]